VRAILGLAKGSGMTTTAEGVEDAGQLAYLKANGCTEGQGYLFSKAVPANEIPALINLQADYAVVAWSAAWRRDRYPHSLSRIRT
jgi:EAL domain-containing protein (putative c-di-GMP-specific phosphodiesterase class I)